MPVWLACKRAILVPKRGAKAPRLLALGFDDDLESRRHQQRADRTVVRGPGLVRATGYSLSELERAGLTAGDASRLGLPVDRTRLTLLGCNVLQLCALADPAHAVRGAP